MGFSAFSFHRSDSVVFSFSKKSPLIHQGMTIIHFPPSLLPSFLMTFAQPSFSDITIVHLEAEAAEKILKMEAPPLTSHFSTMRHPPLSGCSLTSLTSSPKVCYRFYQSVVVRFKKTLMTFVYLLGEVFVEVIKVLY